MDVTVIPGTKELRNNQLIITCEFPVPGIERGRVLSVTFAGFQWRVSHFESAADGRYLVYLDPINPPTTTPYYMARLPRTLDVS